jgi:ferric-dicitrate binding protein FerR (iron transport regulator)
MQRYFTIEELIIDDSFHNYCFKRDEVDVLFWRAYLDVNATQIEVVQEARQIVLGLHAAIKEKAQTEESDNNAKKKPQRVFKRLFQMPHLRLAIAAAAMFVLVVAGKAFFAAANSERRNEAASVNRATVYRTAKGERKVIWLPDNTRINLNSGSELRLDARFGAENRAVYLSGEALFDVTHNDALPFVVHMDDYDIKVLGTLFNVRAYPGEKVSETALVRGKVQIVKKDGGDLTLVPHQKVIFKSIPKKETRGFADSSAHLTMQKIVPVIISAKDGSIVETLWAQNKLEIVNESFESMKQKLERWYNVEIVFADNKVRQYTFTATFEKEDIQQVLAALQYTYPFSFKIKEKRIILSK